MLKQAKDAGWLLKGDSADSARCRRVRTDTGVGTIQIEKAYASELDAWDYRVVWASPAYSAESALGEPALIVDLREAPAADVSEQLRRLHSREYRDLRAKYNKVVAAADERGMLHDFPVTMDFCSVVGKRMGDLSIERKSTGECCFVMLWKDENCAPLAEREAVREPHRVDVSAYSAEDLLAMIIDGEEQ